MQPTGNPGLSPEIMEAMARRSQGQPSPQSQQQSPGVPGGQQMPQPTSPSAMPTNPMPVEQPKQPKFEPQTAKDLIVEALISQLDIENKASEQAQTMGTSQPTQPQGGGMGMSNPMNQQTDYPYNFNYDGGYSGRNR